MPTQSCSVQRCPDLTIHPEQPLRVLKVFVSTNFQVLNESVYRSCAFLIQVTPTATPPFWQLAIFCGPTKQLTKMTDLWSSRVHICAAHCPPHHTHQHHKAAEAASEILIVIK